MPKAVIEDQERFLAFLAAQPLCAWSAQKARELALRPPPHPGIHLTYESKPAKKRNDNAELAAALASMA
ncbi:MAG: hypothetical protein N3C63_03025 [Rhodocyclaceae bacterium]|nr:hypothetical protein [Rhodocyclaceae bacterium]